MDQSQFNAELAQQISMFLITTYSQGQSLTPEQLWAHAGGSEEAPDMFRNPETGSSQAYFALTTVSGTCWNQRDHYASQGNAAIAQMFQSMGEVAHRASIVSSPMKSILDILKGED